MGHYCINCETVVDEAASEPLVCVQACVQACMQACAETQVFMHA